MRKNNSKPEEAPISAMIDVVFLLLVFFIITAEDTKTEGFLTINLQHENKDENKSVGVPSIKINIKSNNKVIIGDREFTVNQSNSKEEYEEELVKLRQNIDEYLKLESNSAPKDIKVTIKCDSESYRDLFNVIQNLLRKNKLPTAAEIL